MDLVIGQKIGRNIFSCRVQLFRKQADLLEYVFARVDATFGSKSEYFNAPQITLITVFFRDFSLAVIHPSFEIIDFLGFFTVFILLDDFPTCIINPISPDFVFDFLWIR